MKNMNKFIVIMPSYNVAKWIGLSIETLKLQSYKNFECVFVDDCSTDNTVEIVKKHIDGDDRFHLINNNKNDGSALSNHIKAFDYINPDDDDIIIRVDGDDWLSSVFALEYLNQVYNLKDIWMTYGTYQVFPSGNTGEHHCIDIPDEVHQKNAYRQWNHVYSHIRTHKAFLFRAIDRNDMINPNTNHYYAEAEDCAHLFSMAEMSGKEHIYKCEDILYTLNRENPLNDAKIALDIQKSNEQQIRKGRVYDKLIRYNSINPLDLLSPKRFDILAKILYAKGRKNNYKTDFHLNVYKEHLLAWNGLHSDFDGKSGLNEYTESFDKILDSIQTDGFDDKKSLVPLTENLTPLNGSHRVAACITHDKNVSCTKGIEGKDGMVCDFNYLKKLNLEQKWMDAMALEYSCLKDDSYIVSLFPSVSNKNDEEVRDMLKEVGDIVYEKDIYLNNMGALKYTIEMYYNEPFIGNHLDGYHGANNKAKLCFTNPDKPLKVFLMKFPQEDVILRDLKNRIRNLFGMGNHSVHMNDTHEETVRLSKLLFNENSIHFLNNSNVQYYRTFEEQLNYFKQFIIQNELDIDDYCITASSVLSMYGLREGKDLDYLHRGVKISGHNMISSHNEYSKGRYNKSIDDIIYNPENHFYYNGIKFASLDVVKDLKSKRGESKDISDLKLISNIIDTKKITPSLQTDNNIKIYFAPNWGLSPEQMLIDYKKQSPNELGVWKNIESTTNVDEADYLVIQDNCEEPLLNKFPKNKRLYFSREAMDFESQKKYPNSIVNRFSYWDDSGYLWTKWVYPGKAGGVNRTYNELITQNKNSYVKNKLISCIQSNKRFTPGHNLRWNFLYNLVKNKPEFLDLFGTIDFKNKELKNNDKYYGLAEYKYSLTFDNQNIIKNFAGSQITDSILYYTVPIYWGGCDLGKFFPEGSFISIDIEKEGEIDRIYDLIKNDDYEKRLPALEEARDLILHKYNMWPMLHEIINKGKLSYYG